MDLQGNSDGLFAEHTPELAVRMPLCPTKGSPDSSRPFNYSGSGYLACPANAYPGVCIIIIYPACMLDPVAFLNHQCIRPF
jgi:hypothetical protein